MMDEVDGGVDVGGRWRRGIEEVDETMSVEEVDGGGGSRRWVEGVRLIHGETKRRGVEVVGTKHLAERQRSSEVLYDVDSWKEPRRSTV